MKSNGILKFILIFLLAGVLGGLVFGFVPALIVFNLIYGIELFIFFSIIISLFYIPSFWRAFKNKTYPVFIRKIFEIALIGSMFNAMFLLEAEIIEFNSFDWNVIYICVGLAMFIMTSFVTLEEYYNESWLYKEINHIINGMQIYGLLPSEKEKEK